MGQDEQLTSYEAAALLGVSVKSIALWSKEGKLRHWSTPGGHRRFLRSDVEALRRFAGPEPEQRPTSTTAVA